MTKLTINEVVQGLLELQAQGESATLLGVGPMSVNCIQASLEASKDFDFPMMFIASRNQVDADKFGGGYVNGWDQERFARDTQAVADAINYDNYYYLCRDHGGPWQRDEERNNHLPTDEAMAIGKKSYVYDMKAGFELLMIDPTKDPFIRGKVIPIEDVLSRTVDLIEYCEAERKALGIDEIAYEVGTEETNGGLTTTEIYEGFIQELTKRLKEKNLPLPTFIVGQTGTLVRKTEQAGEFNFENALELAQMAKKYQVGLKEHNGDYLDDVSLLEHNPALVTAINVAPQYGTEETRAYLKLVQVEERLLANQLIDHPSNLKEVLLDKAIASERWRKWMEDDRVDISIEEIKADPALSEEILDIAGHYTFNDAAVKAEIEVLYKNLAKNNIDGQRFVVDHIKRPIQDYVETLNLRGVTSKILALKKTE